MDPTDRVFVGGNDSEAFNVSVQDAEQRRALAVNSAASFEDIFAAGLQALGLELGEVRPCLRQRSYIKMHVYKE